MKKLNKGFTLVELIIVIAILAIIMLIAIPNFSGIQQRMQVRADKQTAAQIGKAIRIWYAERVSDGSSVASLPAMKSTGDGVTKAAEDTNTTNPDTFDGTVLKSYDTLTNIGEYISKTNEPSSLSTRTGAKSAVQVYAPVLDGTDRTSKIMIVIQGSGTVSDTNAGDWSPAYNADTDATEGNDSYAVLYDGSKPDIAYIEP